MAGDTTKYQNLVTSEHADKPKFMQMVKDTAQPSADTAALYNQFPALYDVDSATGQQLDVCGQWVGVSRQLDAPLTGVYFSFDTAGVGFDQGVWKGPFDPDSGLVTLPDDFYRVLIKARILNNAWDGTLDNAYALANAIFNTLGYSFFIVDHGNLTIDIGLLGSGPPSNIVAALLVSGKFNVKPLTIRVAKYIYQSVPGPLFGFDLDNSTIAGFDEGSWASITYN